MKKIAILILSTLYLFNTAYALTQKQTEENKQTVIQFYNEAFNNKDFTAAEKYLGDYYIQHNPLAADGKEGLKQYIEYVRTTYPKSHSEIKRIFAEGDYVIVHVHTVRVPGELGSAIFDLFRFDNGKIVEHWDAIQEVPAQSANNNGMF